MKTKCLYESNKEKRLIFDAIMMDYERSKREQICHDYSERSDRQSETKYRRKDKH